MTCTHCGEPLVKVGHDSHHGVDLYRCGCCAATPPRDLEALARAVVERLATVHERHACPKCLQPIGERCVHAGSWRPLEHSHVERRRLEVPDR